MDAKALAMASRLPYLAAWPERPMCRYSIADDASAE